MGILDILSYVGGFSLVLDSSEAGEGIAKNNDMTSNKVVYREFDGFKDGQCFCCIN